MTVKELIDTLTAKRRAQGYAMWKQAYLIQWAILGKHFPKSPEQASPELFPKRKIQMPPNLLKKHLARMKGEVKYE